MEQYKIDFLDTEDDNFSLSCVLNPNAVDALSRIGFIQELLDNAHGFIIFGDNNTDIHAICIDCNNDEARNNIINKADEILNSGCMKDFSIEDKLDLYGFIHNIKEMAMQNRLIAFNLRQWYRAWFLRDNISFDEKYNAIGFALDLYHQFGIRIDKKLEYEILSFIVDNQDQIIKPENEKQKEMSDTTLNVFDSIRTVIGYNIGALEKTKDSDEEVLDIASNLDKILIDLGYEKDATLRESAELARFLANMDEQDLDEFYNMLMNTDDEDKGGNENA